MKQTHSSFDGPARDPLQVAAEQAAARLALGLPLADYDLDALKQWASNELREIDLAECSF